jgi:hypothetical protein
MDYYGCYPKIVDRPVRFRTEPDCGSINMISVINNRIKLHSEWAV